MTVRLRKARLYDLPTIVSIKEALHLFPGQQPNRGGFLLGCSTERYAQLIDSANILVLEAVGTVTGFAVTLPDHALRSSELWARRAAILWEVGESEPPANERVAYFDQLALHPKAHRRYAPALALAAVRELALTDHVHLYATTLAAPVSNEAAFPLLRALGMRTVGRVDEHYSGVGHVVSELHYAALQVVLDAIGKTPLCQKTARETARLAA